MCRHPIEGRSWWCFGEQQQAVCTVGEANSSERHAPYMQRRVSEWKLGRRGRVITSPACPSFAACVGLIACPLPCFACVFVRARCQLPAVPIAMQAMQQGALLRLGWLARWAVGCARGYDGASKLEGWLRLAPQQANERAVRAWACVRSGCGWCVNRDLSVTREIWTGRRKGRRDKAVD